MSKVLVASRNAIKLEEIRDVISQAEPVDVELSEVQSTDPRIVVEHKLDQVARMGFTDPVLVEDTGLSVDAWDALPGALVKWFVERLGAQGLKDAAVRGDAPTAATASCAVGIYHAGEREVWEGQVSGHLVDARGPLGGWTPVFEVADTGRTLGEMTFSDRMRWTMRSEPLRSAREWLEKREIHVSGHRYNGS